MHGLRQALALINFSARSLPQRTGPSVVIVLGVAGVVAVLLAVLGISGSLQRVIALSGRLDRAIVLSTSAKSEAQSALTRENIASIESAPGISRGIGGKPRSSPEAITQYHVVDTARGIRSEVVIRGVGLDPTLVRPEIQILQGRLMNAGRYEVIVGKRAQEQYQELTLGRKISIAGAPWAIVGVFDTGGNAHSSELFADVDTLMSSIHRNSYNSVLVKLSSAEAFRSFKHFLNTDPSISVEVYREADYYGQQSEAVMHAWSFLAYVVGSIMALGAMIAAANTMYSSVAVRSVEIATLRAIGFRPDAVVIAVLTEALFLALLGAILGTVIVWLLFSGNAISTKFGAGRAITRLSLEPSLIALGMLWALAISLVGGLFPAVWAARVPVVEALRE